LLATLSTLQFKPKQKPKQFRNAEGNNKKCSNKCTHKRKIKIKIKYGRGNDERVNHENNLKAI